MKTLALLSLSLAVALGMPAFTPDMAQNHFLTEEDQSPLLEDLLPVQGHEKMKLEVGVKQADEAKTGDKKEPEFKAEPEVKLEPEVKVEPEVIAEPEVKVELDVQEEIEPEVKPIFHEEQAVQEVQDKSQVQMNFEPETETGRAFVRAEEPFPVVGMQPFEEPAMDDSPLLDGGVQTSDVPKTENMALMRQEGTNPAEGRLSPREDKQATRWKYCPGVSYGGKCYQFFREPKKAIDAEFFCQRFPGGHLASITSQYIHRQVVSMMRAHSTARTWIGGIRFLKTGRFIWLDGSHWSYVDWLLGEPNNTSHVEDCVELLAFRNGKFNDFTCWEPQSFVCSYPH